MDQFSKQIGDMGDNLSQVKTAKYVERKYDPIKLDSYRQTVMLMCWMSKNPDMHQFIFYPFFVMPYFYPIYLGRWSSKMVQ